MGLYELCCMPFELSGAPRSFLRLMDEVLHGLPFVVIYLDDILIYSTDINQHADIIQHADHYTRSSPDYKQSG